MNKSAHSRTSLGDNGLTLASGAAGRELSLLEELASGPEVGSGDLDFDLIAFPAVPEPVAYPVFDEATAPEALAVPETEISAELAALVEGGLGDSGQAFDLGLLQSESEPLLRTLSATARAPEGDDVHAGYRPDDTGLRPNDIVQSQSGITRGGGSSNPAKQTSASTESIESSSDVDHTHPLIMNPELARLPGGIGSVGNAVRDSGNRYIDGLLWGGKWETNIGPITYHFVEGSYDGFFGASWRAYEKQAFYDSFAILESFANVQFQEVGLRNQANLRPMIVNNAQLGAGTLGAHEVPVGQDSATGLFNRDGLGWNNSGLDVGGFGFVTVAHELGHGLGLAHPHDNGGHSSIYPGVTSPFDTGTNGLNSGIYTIMSYNDLNQPWSPNSGAGFGFQSYMAFDIAALQRIYGANNSHAGGNDTYALPQANISGTFYQAIWDTGGTDTLSYNGGRNAVLDLRAAPLTGAKAGGYLSSAAGIFGGYTIANGVQIENATAGSGDDRIIGNNLSNSLSGGSGRDQISGGSHRDFIFGGDGNDRLSGDHSGDRIYGESGHDVLLGGNGWDRLFGGAGNDRLDGGSAGDILSGGLGNDQLFGGSGADWADYSSAGGAVQVDLRSFRTTGADGTDSLDSIENVKGSNYNDSLLGDNSSNTIWAEGGDDFVRSYRGNDTINGGDGNDQLGGFQGRDLLYGGAGDDGLWGGNDADRLYGNSGNDRLEGGPGNDYLAGGSGHDTIVITKGSGSDRVRDFDPSEDSILLRHSIQLQSILDQDVNNDGLVDSIVNFSGGNNLTLLGLSGLDGDDLNLIFAA